MTPIGAFSSAWLADLAELVRTRQVHVGGLPRSCRIAVALVLDRPDLLPRDLTVLAAVATLSPDALALAQEAQQRMRVS